MKVKNPSIYTVQHIESGRSYIGSATYPSDRFDHHRWALRAGRHGNKHLQNAWNKYGEGAFKFEILERVSDVCFLQVREQYWIDNTPIRFNIRPFANDNRGFRHSECTKAKMRGRVVAIETREKLAKIWLGKSLSADHRAKIRASKIGQLMSEVTRTKNECSLRRSVLTGRNAQNIAWQ